MKIRPLPETDLGRIAPMPREMKRQALEQLKAGWGGYSYLPSRVTLPDILNTQYDLLPTSEPTHWSKVHDRICERSRSKSEQENNLVVAQLLYDYAHQKGCVSSHSTFGSVATGIARPVRYWSDLVVTLGSESFIPFFDPRRGKRLTSRGRRFAFSMMHENIRVRDSDYAGLSLRIFQFSSETETEVRTLRIYSDTDVEMYSFDELNEMIQETYEIWEEVLTERESKNRARGGRGTLI